MVSMTGGRGPAMTGGPGYIRDGAAPYREPGSRKPEEAFALLLSSGADPNAKAPDGSTPLHQAVAARQVAIIRALVTAGAKLDAVNQDNRQAIWSTSSGTVPASASAFPAAVAALSASVSSGPAKQRVRMPLRRRIHSGDESRVRQISSLVTICRGR